MLWILMSALLPTTSRCTSRSTKLSNRPTFPPLGIQRTSTRSRLLPLHARYLTEYSHWGYCDLDMVIGNLPLFMEHAELAKEDIVTYSFGDVDALYLRGQWTMHRNARETSVLWKAAPCRPPL